MTKRKNERTEIDDIECTKETKSIKSKSGSLETLIKLINV